MPSVLYVGTQTTMKLQEQAYILLQFVAIKRIFSHYPLKQFHLARTQEIQDGSRGTRYYARGRRAFHQPATYRRKSTDSRTNSRIRFGEGLISGCHQLNLRHIQRQAQLSVSHAADRRHVRNRSRCGDRTRRRQVETWRSGVHRLYSPCP